MWLRGIFLLFFYLRTCSSFVYDPSTIIISRGNVGSKTSPTSSIHYLLKSRLFGSNKEESQQTDLSKPTRVLKIPVASLKQGGLRFSLGLYLIGLQDGGMWRANEASSTILDMYYKDNSAMFQIVLKANAINVDRYGQPSLAYVLQESLVLHSVLDEINKLCNDLDDIKTENRLIQLENADAIEKARATLPARKAS